jgi:hypothetical protein
MIASINDIKNIRPIADNIPLGRITVYIEEAERLYVLPAFGASLFKNISDNQETYTTLLEGGYYDNDNHYFAGLRKSIAYIAYSKMILNQDFNVTAFGTMFKNSEYSEHSNEKTLLRISNDALAIGLRYLDECLDYLKHINVLTCCLNQTDRNRRIKIIGEI